MVGSGCCKLTPGGFRKTVQSNMWWQMAEKFLYFCLPYYSPSLPCKITSGFPSTCDCHASYGKRTHSCLTEFWHAHVTSWPVASKQTWYNTRLVKALRWSMSSKMRPWEEHDLHGDTPSSRALHKRYSHSKWQPTSAKKLKLINVSNWDLGTICPCSKID